MTQSGRPEDYDPNAWMQVFSDRLTHKDELDPVSDLPTASLPALSWQDPVSQDPVSDIPTVHVPSLSHQDAVSQDPVSDVPTVVVPSLSRQDPVSDLPIASVPVLSRLDDVSDTPTMPTPVPGAWVNGRLRRDPLKSWSAVLEKLQTTRALLIILVVLILFSIGSLSVGGWINGMTQLQQMRTLAHAGLQHLENIRAVVDLNHLDQALSTTTLNKVQTELSAAEQDFGALRRMLAEPQGTFAVASHLPWAGSVLASAKNLAAAADELCFAGYAFAQDGQLILRVLQGGLFAGKSTTGAKTGGNAVSTMNSPPPLVLDMTTYTQLRAILATALTHLRSAIGYAQQADLSVLPSSIVKPQQVAEIRQLLAKWPQIQTATGQVNTALDALPAVFGLTSPSKYLIELMDSTELRPGGGFIGNYAVITVVNGKVQPVTVSDTYLLDYPYLASHGDVVPAPSQYSWWPFKTIYGLRDSNLSGDFPTSARYGMQQLTREGGPAVQGVIAVTPAAIEGVIHILGPIPMPQYGQVVTDNNLEHLIHLYELVPSEQPLAPLPPGEQISSPTKRFTALLGQAFLQKLHSLSLAQQVAVGKQLLGSVRSKDIQVFLTNAQAEGLLSKDHLDGAFPTAAEDGLSIVDANLTPSKGSQFVTVTESDNVVLDAQGDATHHLTLTYQFEVTNSAELYGADYYLTYLRIYAPAQSQLLSLQGFTNLYGDDRIGHSDQPGYQMWGGFLFIQDQQPYTLRLSWRVPHAASRGAHGEYTYSLDYNRQAGLQQLLYTTISVAGSTSRPAYSYAGHLYESKIINVTYRG